MKNKILIVGKDLGDIKELGQYWGLSKMHYFIYRMEGANDLLERELCGRTDMIFLKTDEISEAYFEGITNFIARVYMKCNLEEVNHE